MRCLTWHIAILTPLCAVLFFAGCTEEVAAPTGVEEPFSMYGILNPRLNQQTLLVSPIEPLLDDLPASIDAAVSSTDLETGETIVWTDSVVRGERGQLDHVYVADFRARFGGRYRVEVARSDGAASSAVANVPEEVDITSKDLAPHFLDVRASGEGFHLLNAEVVYTVRYYAEGMSDGDLCLNSPAGSYAVSYADEIIETDDGYRLRIDLDRDHERVLGSYQLEHPFAWWPNLNGVALMNMKVKLLIAEPAWRPVAAANVLADPNVMTNVSNGFGFVGGGYNEDRHLYPGERTVEQTPFFDFLMRPPGQCLNYCACGWK